MESIRDILQKKNPRRIEEELEREAQRRAEIARVNKEFDLGLEPESLLEEYRLLRLSDDGLREFLLRVSGLAALEPKRLSDFKPRSRYPDVATALEAAKAFVSDPRAPCLLTLAGPPGTGKSHLLLGIAWELVERGCLVLYRRQPDLMLELRKSFESHGFESTQRGFMEAGWLVIDDLGIEGLTEWGRGVLDSLIDYRWSHRLPLAVGTNLKSSDLSPRLADRLNDRMVGRVVQIAAPSYRKEVR